MTTLSQAGLTSSGLSAAFAAAVALALLTAQAVGVAAESDLDDANDTASIGRGVSTLSLRCSPAGIAEMAGIDGPTLFLRTGVCRRL